jgi:hypothetical protein
MLRAIRGWPVRFSDKRGKSGAMGPYLNRFGQEPGVNEGIRELERAKNHRAQSIINKGGYEVTTSGISS